MFTNYYKYIFLAVIISGVWSAVPLLNRKFIVRRDMSDYCKRGVLTSLFLGTHVIDANSQILQFSKRESPYSCHFCVRTEYGNNLVMVIRSTNDSAILDTCKTGGNQVVVHNMGETFGGYWASMPDFIMKPKKYPTGVYTIEPTEPETETTTEITTPENRHKGRKKHPDGEFSIEIPIVNISMRVDSGEMQNANILDVLLDVDRDDRIMGETITTDIPLLNFSVWRADEEKFLNALTHGHKKSTKKHARKTTKKVMNAALDDDYDYDKGPSIDHEGTTTDKQRFELLEYEYKTDKGGDGGGELQQLVDYIIHHDDTDSGSEDTASKDESSDDDEKSLSVNAEVAGTEKIVPTQESSKKASKTTMTIKNRYTQFDKTHSPFHRKTKPTTSETSESSETHKTVPMTTPSEPPTTTGGHRDIDPETSVNKNNMAKKEEYFDEIINIISSTTTHKTTKTSNMTTHGNTESSSTHPSVSMVDHESWENVVKAAQQIVETLNTTLKGSSQIVSKMPNVLIITNPKTVSPISKTTGKVTNLDSASKTIVKTKTPKLDNTVKTSVKTKSPNFDKSDKTTKSTKTTKLHDMVKTTVKTKPPNIDHISQHTVKSKTDHGTQIPMTKSSASSVTERNKKVKRRYGDKVKNYDGTAESADDDSDITDDKMLPELYPDADDRRHFRKKRHLDPIPIKNSYPRSMNDALVTASNVTPHPLQIPNIEKIEQRVELQNDKVNSRLSIRYGTHFLGDEMFNLCDGAVLQSRHVFLFNTSRIMIHIDGFEMDMVTIVLTEGRVVSGTNCEEEYLECQLAGTRVCIDAMNACDGVPNCGADDIYDEDRLKCGYLLGVQHDVYLAAVTFLVLILTLLYVIHYWLKRCVPKVSSAFFVYTEGAEVKLNLDSIMRPPLGEDIAAAYKRQSMIPLDYEHVFRQMSVANYKIPFKEKLKSFFGFYIQKSKHVDMIFQERRSRMKKAYSFTESEMQKLNRHVDAWVQTDECLELAPLNSLGNDKSFHTNYSDFFDVWSEELDERNELNVLNFCRDASCKGCSIGTNTVVPMSVLKPEKKDTGRSLSQQYDNISIPTLIASSNSEESLIFCDQLQSDSLEQELPDKVECQSRPRLGSVELIRAREGRRVESVDVHTETIPKDKKLRFDEIAVTIDHKGTEEDRPNRSVYGTQQLGAAPDTMDAIEEAPADYSPAAEIKKFLLGKNKKCVKKKPMSNTR